MPYLLCHVLQSSNKITIYPFLIQSMLCLPADEDECALNSHDCDYNAECINAEGSYSCICKPGYSGDGKTCTREIALFYGVPHLWAS